jgi:hypothetical protein
MAVPAGKGRAGIATGRPRSYTAAMRMVLLILATIALAGCARGPLAGLFEARDETRAADPGPVVTRPLAREDTDDGAGGPDEPVLSGTPPPSTARTGDGFDTTTQAERASAAAPEPLAGERRLGETVASLGDPAQPGFWLETPLVKEQMQGRVLFPATGKSAQVTLIPIDGPETAGSRLSIAAMRLIGAPLTALPTIEVRAGATG